MRVTTHGTNASYVAGCRCDACRAATRKYHKALVLDHHRGIRRLVDATGTRRRIEALGALGWTGVQIGDRLGLSGEHVRQLRSQSLVTREKAARMAEVYEQLSMTLPPETTRTERHNAARQRNKAARQGWVPPLAWDDIDRDELQPVQNVVYKNAIDEVAVQRALDGERLRLNRAERVAVAQRWAREGRSLNELERIHGWNVCRDSREESACA